VSWRSDEAAPGPLPPRLPPNSCTIVPLLPAAARRCSHLGVPWGLRWRPPKAEESAPLPAPPGGACAEPLPRGCPAPPQAAAAGPARALAGVRPPLAVRVARVALRWNRMSPPQALPRALAPGPACAAAFPCTGCWCAGSPPPGALLVSAPPGPHPRPRASQQGCLRTPRLRQAPATPAAPGRTSPRCPWHLPAGGRPLGVGPG